MREFFGFGGYSREPEGYLSWQHLLFVTALMIIMVISAIILGKKYKNAEYNTKNKVLIWTAIIIDGLEILKIILFCIRGKDPLGWVYELPLFLCSIQLITIPLAAFSKGRLKEASLDFVLIFGLIAAVLGTYLAGNNYAAYPVLCFDNLVSGLTHALSGFASLYIAITKMVSMKKENIYISFIILLGFGITAYIANLLLDYNYMFLMRGDGTPYDIIYNLVNGNKIIYPIIVILLFVLYISTFYYIYYLIKRRHK